MNKKGSVKIYAMMLGLTIILLGIFLAPSVIQVSTEAQNQTTFQNYSYDIINSSGEPETIVGQIENIGMDCTNSSISNFDKATCVITDLSPFYLIGSLIFIGGAVITARLLFGE